MAIGINARVSRSLAASGGVTTVEVGLEPTAKTKPSKRHVALLIDTSGSMKGQKYKTRKRGQKTL